MPVPLVEGVREAAPASPQAIQRDVRERLLAIKGAYCAMHLPHSALPFCNTTIMFEATIFRMTCDVTEGQLRTPPMCDLSLPSLSMQVMSA